LESRLGGIDIHYLQTQEWLWIALIFFALFGGIALWQWRDKRWVARRFRPGEVIIMSFGVTFYGCESTEGRVPQQTGMLLLLETGLLYRTRFLGKEFMIPKERIKAVYVAKQHKGKDLYRYVMKVDFIDRHGRPDSAAFRVPYPKQWFSAIGKTLDITPVTQLPEEE